MQKYKILSLLDIEPKDMVPMDRQFSDLFINTSFYEIENPDNEFSREHVGASQMLNVLLHRLEVYGGKVTLPVAIVAAYASKGNMGNVVMYAWAMSKLYKKTGSIVNLMIFSEVFMFGFPSDKFLDKVWTSQKFHTHNLTPTPDQMDNLLDNPEMIEE